MTTQPPEVETTPPNYNHYSDPIDPSLAKSAYRFLGANAALGKQRSRLKQKATHDDWEIFDYTPSVLLKALYGGRITARETLAAADDIRRQTVHAITEKLFIGSHEFFYPDSGIQPGPVAVSFAGALVDTFALQEETRQTIRSSFTG